MVVRTHKSCVVTVSIHQTHKPTSYARRESLGKGRTDWLTDCLKLNQTHNKTVCVSCCVTYSRSLCFKNGCNWSVRSVPHYTLTRPNTRMLIHLFMINYYWWLHRKSNISGYFISEIHTRSAESPYPDTQAAGNWRPLDSRGPWLPVS
jgi:hypothetical protein